MSAVVRGCAQPSLHCMIWSTTLLWNAHSLPGNSSWKKRDLQVISHKNVFLQYADYPWAGIILDTTMCTSPQYLQCTEEEKEEEMPIVWKVIWNWGRCLFSCGAESTSGLWWGDWHLGQNVGWTGRRNTHFIFGKVLEWYTQVKKHKNYVNSSGVYDDSICKSVRM